MVEPVEEGALEKREPLFVGKLTSVLFVDFADHKHKQFIVKGQECFTRYCKTLESAIADIRDKDWDIIFLPGWYPNQYGLANAPTRQTLIDALTAKKKKPKMIIYTGYMGGYEADEIRYILPLRSHGVLIAHVPWDWSDPSKHTRQKITL